jgi:CRP/FNR family transcriptional regulator, cyclic AMP receptor protein
MTLPQQRFAAGTILGSLAPSGAGNLLALGTTRVFDPPAALITAGDLTADVFVIVHGYVKVLGDTTDGRSVLLSIRVAGELVGELAALSGRPRSASVVAATRVTVRSIGGRQFLAHLAAHPDTATAVHASVIDKLHRATQHRIDINSTSIPLRLALMLRYLSESFGTGTADGVRIDVPLSQGELATLVGASEPTIRRILSVLKRRGIVTTDYRHPVINDPEGLRAFADELALRDNDPDA